MKDQKQLKKTGVLMCSHIGFYPLQDLCVLKVTGICKDQAVITRLLEYAR